MFRPQNHAQTKVLFNFDENGTESSGRELSIQICCGLLSMGGADLVVPQENAIDGGSSSSFLNWTADDRQMGVRTPNEEDTESRLRTVYRLSQRFCSANVEEVEKNAVLRKLLFLVTPIASTRYTEIRSRYSIMVMVGLGAIDDMFRSLLGIPAQGARLRAAKSLVICQLAHLIELLEREDDSDVQKWMKDFCRFIRENSDNAAIRDNINSPHNAANLTAWTQRLFELIEIVLASTQRSERAEHQRALVAFICKGQDWRTTTSNALCDAPHHNRPAAFSSMLEQQQQQQREEIRTQGVETDDDTSRAESSQMRSPAEKGFNFTSICLRASNFSLMRGIRKRLIDLAVNVLDEDSGGNSNSSEVGGSLEEWENLIVCRAAEKSGGGKHLCILDVTREFCEVESCLRRYMGSSCDQTGVTDNDSIVCRLARLAEIIDNKSCQSFEYRRRMIRGVGKALLKITSNDHSSLIYPLIQKTQSIKTKTWERDKVLLLEGLSELYQIASEERQPDVPNPAKTATTKTRSAEKTSTSCSWIRPSLSTTHASPIQPSVITTSDIQSSVINHGSSIQPSVIQHTLPNHKCSICQSLRPLPDAAPSSAVQSGD